MSRPANPTRTASSASRAPHEHRPVHRLPRRGEARLHGAARCRAVPSRRLTAVAAANGRPSHGR